MRIRLLIAIFAASASVLAQTPQGEIKGQATQHTPESSKAVVAGAAVVLPASITGGGHYVGSFRDAPMTTSSRAPVVIFLHGSSGLGLKAIGEWQLWLAGMGIASFAPDSFGLPDRVTYKSPVDKSIYEKIHALRGSEITLAVQALQKAQWADTSRMVLAGTSEGATAVARYTGNEFQGRIVFSWSCEDNYFVQSHMTALPDDKPVLNVISSTDPFFSASNTWLGSTGTGHCGNALKGNKQASVVLIPGAPHTLLNLPAARHPVAGFLRDVLKP